MVDPSASIEDGVLTIETEIATWGIGVTILDAGGNIVYTCENASEGTIHTFAVGILSSGDYIIEVQIGKDTFEGELLI